MNKAVRNILIIVGSLLIVGGITAAGVGIYKHFNPYGSGNPFEKGGEFGYGISIGSGEKPTLIDLYFNSETNEYKMTVTVGELSSDIETGTYSYDAASSTINCVTTSGTEEQYYYDGQYVIYSKSMYEPFEEASIGDKEISGKFKHVMTDGDTDIIDFSDRTFVRAIDTEMYTGTYTIDGRFVKMVVTDGSEWVDFLIYDGNLSNTYYIRNR